MSSREAGTGYAAPPADARIVEALRSGDELAFVALVEEHVPSMLRVARLYVSTHAVAEEVVQEAWVGVLRGIVRFEGRSSLKTWIFRILTNTAKTRGEREGRSVPFSSLAEPGDEGYVDLDRFTPEGRWAVAAGPRSWHGVPEERLVAAETMDRIRAAIEALPDTQRTVITLRDVEGWSSEEVCNVLELTETNQRVLLHRARSRVRNALEAYIAQEEQQ
ncbi:MAG: sigma-70 family RNA polymerase sigma factor [Actinobacteria bacterium]|nr:sigma-70 family RNA polymerase sigma factor [Actinomycetota bacterium]